MNIRMLLLGICALLSAVSVATAEDTIRVGHFPNITHVQGLVAQHLSRTGHGWFEPRLGSDVKIEWYIYNAGPSAMEAILADSIDLTYVGPSPTLNAYAKSNGEEVRIRSSRIPDSHSQPIFAGRPLPPPNSAIRRTWPAGHGCPMEG